MANISRRSFIGAIGAATYPVAARAQGGWRPSEAVRVIVPAAPGGTTDIMGRLLAAHLQPRWGQNVVAENKSGAGGVIGTMEAARARPDGHTMLMGNIGPQSIAYSLFRNLPYNSSLAIRRRGRARRRCPRGASGGVSQALANAGM